MSPAGDLNAGRQRLLGVGSLVASLVVAVFGVAVAAALFVRILGWDLTVVTSGSMVPRIRPGDVVAVRPLGSEGPRPGAVVLFDDAEGRPTLHRVAALEENGSVRTKGDANAGVDSTPVAPSSVHGRAVMVLPYLGHPALAVMRGDWPMLVGFVVVGWLLLSLLAQSWRRPHPLSAGANQVGSGEWPDVERIRPGSVRRPLCARTSPTPDDVFVAPLIARTETSPGPERRSDSTDRSR